MDFYRISSPVMQKSYSVFMLSTGDHSVSPLGICAVWWEWVGASTHLLSCSLLGQRWEVCQARCLPAFFCRFVSSNITSCQSSVSWQMIWSVMFSLAGRRACPGEGLARMELFIFIATLLQQFNFTPPAGVSRDELDLTPTMGVNRIPLPHKLCAVPRVWGGGIENVKSSLTVAKMFNICDVIKKINV